MSSFRLKLRLGLPMAFEGHRSIRLALAVQMHIVSWTMHTITFAFDISRLGTARREFHLRSKTSPQLELFRRTCSQEIMK